MRRRVGLLVVAALGLCCFLGLGGVPPPWSGLLARVGWRGGSCKCLWLVLRVFARSRRAVCARFGASCARFFACWGASPSRRVSGVLKPTLRSAPLRFALLRSAAVLARCACAAPLCLLAAAALALLWLAVLCSL